MDYAQTLRCRHQKSKPAVTAASIDTLNYGGKIYTGDCGAVVGKVDGSDYNVRNFNIVNTFCHGFKRSDPGTKRYDADLVPER